VLTATVAGDMHLIEQASGKVLWKVNGLRPNHLSLTPTQRHVFVNAGSE
jgi:hypothetical protein